MGSCSNPLTPAITGSPITPAGPQSSPGHLAIASPPAPIPLIKRYQKTNQALIMLEGGRSLDSLFAGYPGAKYKSVPNRCPEVIFRRLAEGDTRVHLSVQSTNSQGFKSAIKIIS